MIRILLNCIEPELRAVSGDISYCKSLLESQWEDLKYAMIPSTTNLPRKLLYRINRWGHVLSEKANSKHALVLFQLTPIQSNFLQSEGFDLIHSHLLFPYILGRGRRERIPIVWSSPGINPSWYSYHHRGNQNYLKSVVHLYQRLGQLADLLIIWTQSGAENILKYTDISENKIRVIPPYVKTQPEIRPKKMQDEKTRILFVGNHPRRKGLRDALLAFHRVAQHHRNVRFDIVSSVHEKQLLQLMRHPSITYHGPLSRGKTIELIKTADIFILPTLAEAGLPMVLIEAMANQLPVIAYDVDPMNEFLAHGVEGFLSPVGQLEKLSADLAALLEDPELRNGMGEKAKAKAFAHFSEGVVKEKLKEAYRCAMRSDSPSPGRARSSCKAEKQTISVIVPTYQRPVYLRKCLTSLCQQSRRPDEVIVVMREGDRASQEEVTGLSEALSENNIQLKTAFVSFPGHIPPLIEGKKYACGDIVCFVDDDCEADSQWLERIEHNYDDNRIIGAVGGAAPIYQIETSKLIEFEQAAEINSISWYGRCVANGYKNLAFQHPMEVDFLQGCNMSFRSDVLERINFDLNLNQHAATNYEVDLGFQVKKLNHKLIFDPLARVKHYCAPRTSGLSRLDNLENVFYYSFNYVYVMLKHLPRVRKFVFMLYFFLVGQHSSPGFVIVLTSLANGQKLDAVFMRAKAAFKGKVAGTRAYLKLL